MRSLRIRFPRPLRSVLNTREKEDRITRLDLNCVILTTVIQLRGLWPGAWRFNTSLDKSTNHDQGGYSHN
jgi:hypothetical protein